MKRLMILVLAGCGASQGGEADNSREPTPPPVPVVSEPAAPALVLEPVERRLFPQKYSASSYLENDWNKFQENYLADYLGDDNPETGWTEGKSDVGLGESIKVEHTPLSDAIKLRLEIRNGYQKTPKLFQRNARAKDITLTLLPSGAISKHTLEDKEGWQTLSVEQARGPLQGYEIVFDSVYKGTHYEDLVISDIQTYVTAGTPDNPSFEKSKQEHLLAWVDGRREAAKTFKEAAKGSIPVAANYVMQSSNEGYGSREGCEDDCPSPFEHAATSWGDKDGLFAGFEKALGSKFEDWKPLRVSVSDKRRIPQTDHFNFTASWSGEALIYAGDEAAITLPLPGQLAFFSAKSLQRVYDGSSPVPAAQAMVGKAPGCKQEGKDTMYYYTPESEGPLRTLLIASCGLYEDRDGYTSGSYWQLLHYDADGQLAYLFDFYSGYRFAWSKVAGNAFLKSVDRVSTAGVPDTRFVAK